MTAVCVPAEHRRKALLVGAMLGTLPDLDVFIDYGDVVRNFTFHRGFSHSLFVLPGVAVAIWLVLKRWWAPVRAAPLPWLAAIGLALLTHPLLDAHTAYGTQLFWPLSVSPTSWATLFIIDPLYTVPLLIGIIAALIAGHRWRWGYSINIAGLVLSTGYLLWTLGVSCLAVMAMLLVGAAPLLDLLARIGTRTVGRLTGVSVRLASAALSAGRRRAA